MKDERSLWNITKKKKEVVFKYISDLEPFDRWDINQKKVFEKLKAEALNLELTANKSLELIGYQFKKHPEIYDRIEDMETKK